MPFKDKVSLGPIAKYKLYSKSFPFNSRPIPLEINSTPPARHFHISPGHARNQPDRQVHPLARMGLVQKLLERRLGLHRQRLFAQMEFLYHQRLENLSNLINRQVLQY